jgi:hypothetical protein
MDIAPGIFLSPARKERLLVHRRFPYSERK